MDQQFETGSQTSEPQSHSASLGGYFCSNCHYSIAAEADYKKHYKSEFHRYNIKRRLVNLPPATFEQFLKRKNKAMESRVKSKESLIELYKCSVCTEFDKISLKSKSYGTKTQYDQHLVSKKHKENEAAAAAAAAQAENEIPKKKKDPQSSKTTLEDVNICLFCNKQLDNLKSNLVHMRVNHSFFISEFEYCKNSEGLIKYLAEKINIGLLCIYCENKGTRDFKSAEAVRSHMTDRGHCFMNTEHFDEYIKFFDFSAQYKNLDLIKEKVNPNEKKEGEEYIEIVDEEGDEGEWEDEDKEEDEWEDEEAEVDEDKSKNENPTKDGAKRDMEFFKAEREKKKATKYVYLRVKKAKLLDTGEIELPTGKILGNRVYKHIYKQYYRNRASVNERIKMIVGHDMNQNQIALYRRNNQIVLSSRVLEYKARRKLNRLEDAHIRKLKAAHLDIGVKANKLQPFFRQQCPL